MPSFELTQPAPPPPPSKAGAQAIDPRRLDADPNAFKGQNVTLRGFALTVQQQNNYTWVQLMAQVPGTSNLAPYDVVAMVRPKDQSLVGSQCYRVYGIVTGTSSMRLKLTGAEQQVPTLDAYAIEPIAGNSFGCR